MTTTNRIASAGFSGILPRSSSGNAVTALIERKGLDVLSGMGEADEGDFSKPLTAAIENFANTVFAQADTDAVLELTRKIKVGRTDVFVACVFDNERANGREYFGFFDKNGNELSRLSAEISDNGMELAWRNRTTNRKGDIITPVSSERISATFKREFEKLHDELNGDDLGEDIDVADMPPAVRARYAHIDRTTGDGTGAKKFEFQGKTVYALHDYSCVATAYYMTETGKVFFSFSA